MNFLSVSPLLLRLSKCAIDGSRTIFTASNPLRFGITNVLLAEPLKKKKKLDPAIVKQREEKRRKKLEKSIRRLEKSARKLKPIDELEIPLCLKFEDQERLRKLPPKSEEEEERRILLQKEWSRYKHKQFMNDMQTIDRFIASQQKALNELRAASEELYNEAIQLDPSFIPYVTKGPVHTPPIENYDSPDGEYIDLTVKYPGET